MNLLLACALVLQNESPGQLIEKLRSEKIEEREDATRKLSAMGEGVRLALEKASKDNDPEFASRAKELLRSIVTHKVPERIETYLRWLPEDTETVMVAQEPFVLEKPDPRKPPPIERSLKYLPGSILFTLSKGVYSERVVGKTLSLAVEGGRHFRSPAGLGMMRFSGCQILVFQKDLGSAGDDIFSTMKKDAPSRKIEGHEVVSFVEKLEKDDWSFLVARPRGDVLLLATNEDYLTEVLRRLSTTPARRALPDELAEWKHVDTAAGFWAVRHYDAKSAPLDPSSPLRGKAAANVLDPKAIGMTFSMRDSDKTLSVKYLTGAEDGLLLARNQWEHEGEGLTPAILLAEPGIVDIRVTRGDVRSEMMFLFVLLATLGHAIYL